ncbi:MAG: hypothetical protein ACOXZR_00705 [Bacilli bacterium]|jgi:hypothetical protein
MKLEDKKIFLIGGKARNGKTTIGKMLKEEYEKQGYKVVIMQLMTPLKGYIKTYFNWDGQEETKPRELLQKLGTEVIREKLGKKYFYVNRLIEDIEILSSFFDVFIIDDVRFKLEIDKIREVFPFLKALKIIRRNYQSNLTEEQQQHISEIDLDDYEKVEYKIINDGTLEELKEKIKQIVKEEF